MTISIDLVLIGQITRRFGGTDDSLTKRRHSTTGRMLRRRCGVSNDFNYTAVITLDSTRLA